MGDERLRILLIEDNPGDARLLQYMLADAPGFAYSLEHADRLSLGMQLCAERPPHVILLDLSLPDSQGLDTFLTMQRGAPTTPIVVLTGLNDENFALAAVQAGAQDYLVKGEVQSALLVRSLRYAIERKQLLLQVEAEHRWLRTIIDQSPAGIVLVEGPQGSRVTANRRAEELFGFALTLDQGIAQFIDMFCDAGGKPISYERTALAAALRGEAAPLEESMIWRVDGSEIHAAMSASPIQNPSGAVIGAVLVIEDLTSLKEIERLRREWTAVVAHELRQTSSLIGLQANTLRRLIEPAAATLTTLNNIINSASQLNRIVTDLLDFARIDAQELRIAPRNLDLPALVGAVIDRMAESMPNHAIVLEIGEDIPPVLADAQRLEQVLTNILSNAAKYGTLGAEITVRICQSGPEVQIAISNVGAGISAEELPQLFNRFYRSKRVLAKGISGLGLGLYITQGLVHAHGGRIWAESVPGEVTTFHFTLPVAQLSLGHSEDDSDSPLDRGVLASS